ncbi:hypothetical protein ALC53_12362 [Atta colombica]|uniref:Uncharacterized protein n=1 Tax=Atta colombica TaxID=520822 RepID=A0A195AZB8_9HYME|nr:hypothetical protein ALC53_12362 [Atta colombica]
MKLTTSRSGASPSRERAALHHDFTGSSWRARDSDDLETAPTVIVVVVVETAVWMMWSNTTTTATATTAVATAATAAATTTATTTPRHVTANTDTRGRGTTPLNFIYKMSVSLLLRGAHTDGSSAGRRTVAQPAARSDHSRQPIGCAATSCRHQLPPPARPSLAVRASYNEIARRH